MQLGTTGHYDLHSNLMLPTSRQLMVQEVQQRRLLYLWGEQKKYKVADLQRWREEQVCAKRLHAKIAEETRMREEDSVKLDKGSKSQRVTEKSDTGTRNAQEQKLDRRTLDKKTNHTEKEQ